MAKNTYTLATFNECMLNCLYLQVCLTAYIVIHTVLLYVKCTYLRKYHKKKTTKKLNYIYLVHNYFYIFTEIK